MSNQIDQFQLSQLAWDRRWYYVRGNWPAGFCDACYAERIVPRFDDEGVLQPRCVREHLLDDDELPNTGLLWLLPKFGAVGRNEVERLLNHRSGQQARQAAWEACSKPTRFPHVLRFMARWPAGLIKHRLTTAQRDELFRDIVQCFQTQRIAFVAPTDNRARSVYEVLRHVEPNCKWFGSKAADYTNEPTSRVVVGIPSMAGNTDAELEHVDIVVVTDAITAVGREAARWLIGAERAALFGLVDERRHLSRHQRDRMFAMFGPHLAHAPAPGMRRRSIRFHFHPFRSGRSGADMDGSMLDQVAAHIWRDHHRNRVVAALAKRIADGNRRQLRQRDPDLANLLGNAQPKVVVAVGSIEHQQRLAQLLPTFQPVEPARSDDPVSMESSAIGQQLAGQSLILTPPDLHRIDCRQVDVVVWAGGGPHGRWLPAEAWYEQTGEPTSPLTVVDFSDARHRMTRRWADWRRCDYIDCDFTAGAPSLCDTRVNEFIRRHRG